MSDQKEWTREEVNLRFLQITSHAMCAAWECPCGRSYQVVLDQLERRAEQAAFEMAAKRLDELGTTAHRIAADAVRELAKELAK
jgi:hypothetical protein